jgi:putative ABC transport system permease protein
MAVEVAMAGVALGVLAGWVVGMWVLDIIRDELPLPVWHTPWRGGLFLRAAILGLAIPLVGSVYPVWRAVRVTPTDALLPPHLRSRHYRSSGLLRRIRLPGSTLAQAPIRRITIAPTRSIMTILAIGLILAPLLAALGTTDSATAAIDTGFQIRTGHDQLSVSMTSYQPATSAEVRQIVDSPTVARYSLGLDTGGYLVRGGTAIGVSISMVDLSDPLAVPAAVAARRIAPGGIVISAKAASDLGISRGERVTLRHPLRQGAGYKFVNTMVPVRAVVNSPYRFVAYMSLEDEPMMGLDGIVNTATLLPKHGVTMRQLQRSISALPGVAWALPTSALNDTIRNILSLVTGLFIVLQIVIGLLAFLVAYNSTRIGSDERAREHATMMAFGVPVRRVVRVGVTESVLLGMVGVAVGLGVGLLVLHWVLGTIFPAAVPELSVEQSVVVSSYLITAVIGLAATATAPTLVARQLRRMDVPSTLRYVE